MRSEYIQKGVQVLYNGVFSTSPQAKGKFVSDKLTIKLIKSSC
jgi:hypothetical protein